MKKISLLIVASVILCNAFVSAENGEKNLKVKTGKWQTLTKSKSSLNWKNYTTEFIENEITLRFQPNVTESEIDSFCARFDLSDPEPYGLEQMFILKTNDDPIAKIEEIKNSNDARIIFIEPNLIWKQCDVPNDSLYIPSQWGLQRIKMDSVWDNFLPGEPIILGMPDGGLPIYFSGSTHKRAIHEDFPHFADASPDTNIFLISRSVDFIENQTGEYAVQDLSGHGTAVISKLTTQRNNITGMAGMLDFWPVQYITDQIWSQYGNGTLTAVVNSIKHCVDEGCKVINFSGSGGYSYAVEQVIAYAREHGVWVVASAGNEAWYGLLYIGKFSTSGVFDRNGYENVIAVGSVTKHDKRSVWSSVGPEITCVAPSDSDCVATPDKYHFYLEQYGWKVEYYKGASGTSFASPIVAGLVTMLVSKQPNITFEQVKEIIIETSEKIGAQYVMDENGDLFSVEMGYGLVNIYRALNYAEEHFPAQITNKSPISSQTIKLFQNYPNPFNPTTTINFYIAKKSFVNLKIYNCLGQEISTPINELKNSGNHKINFDGSKFSSGIYFYKIEAVDINDKKIIKTKKMLLIK